MKPILQAAFVIRFVFSNFSQARAEEVVSNVALRGQGRPKTLSTKQKIHKRNFGSRIIGGNEATPGRYKYYVSLHDDTFGHFCGASLITNDTVISAAHCGGGLYQAVIDTHSLNAVSENDKFDIDKEVIHPGYSDSGDGSNDIMLLFLNEPVTARNHKVEYVKLNSDSTVPNSGDRVTVIGHGLTDEFGFEVSSVLMEVDVVALSNEECKENSYGDLLSDDMLCAADTAKDSCQGDSGGPLFIAGNHSSGAFDAQVGIVSWGFGCADEQYPGVYTRISEHYDWIQREVCTHSAFAEDFDCANLPPTTSPPTVTPILCPPEYDFSKTDYQAGDQIEFEYGIYQCLDGCFTKYCSITAFDSDWDLTEQTLWLNAWIYVGEDCNTKQENLINNNPTSAPSQFSIPTSAPTRFSRPETNTPTPSDADKVIRVADGCIRSEKNEVQVDMCLATEHTSPVSVNCCSGSIGGGDLECDRRGCFATADFESAKSHCEDKNMRLCSREELETEVCCMLGCGFDRNITWTSDTDCFEPI